MQKLLRGLLRPSTFVPLIILILSFALAIQLLDYDSVAIIINGIIIAVWIVVAKAYTPLLIESLREETPTKQQYLVTGVLMVWTAFAFSRIWADVYVVLGRPENMMNHWFPYLCFLTSAMSGFYFIKVPDNSDSGWGYTVFAVVGAVVISTLVLAYIS